jgi:hypothetical protein
MTHDFDDRYRRLLAKQLVMNKETWTALQSHGVTASTPLRLDFAFAAPNRAKAEALRALLVDQTDYGVEVQSAGALFRRRWSVTGSTKPTAISAEILAQWVTWMVTAGIQEDCDFDGWGAEV